MPAPSRVEIVPWGSLPDTSGTVARSFGNTSFDLGWFSSTTQDAYTTYPVFLRAGTWSITTTYNQVTTGAIYTVSLDGVTVGTIDSYGTATPNTVSTISGITVAADGVYPLKYLASTRNGSSSGWEQRISHITLQRTGA